MEPTPFSLTWLDILKLALSTGVVAALVSPLFGLLRDWIRDREAAKRDGRYLALRLAVIFEGFAIACADLISANDDQREIFKVPEVGCSQLPPLGEYPTDADWKSLDPAFSAQALAFRNELAISVSTVQAMLRLDELSASGECDMQAGKSGFRAWELATNLRHAYSLPEFDLQHTPWKFVELLKKYHDQAMAKE